MKRFVIIQSSSKEFPVVVMSTGINLPQDHLEDVAEELRQRRVCGDVVFDLLTSNGSRAKRFFATGFDGSGFMPRPRFKEVDPTVEVREATARYLCGHLGEFDLSLLTPAMRFAATRGIAL